MNPFSARAKPLLVLVLGVLLSACATVGPPGGGGAQSAWSARRAALAAMADWELRGRIALRTAQGAWQARLIWRQHRDRYEIDVLSVFGQRLARLSGGPAGAELRLPRGRSYHAADAEGLMRARLGWTLPVAGLRHWVLGLPAPDLTARRTLDTEGRLLSLEQGGWAIAYRRYRMADGLALPGQVTLERDAVRLRLVVDQWRIAERG